MELVIKLDDETYKEVLDRTEFDTLSLGVKLIEAVQNGIPLPKGHGDLIDKSKIYKAIPAEEDNCTGMGMTFEEMDAYNEGIDAMYSLVRGAKPIIEADKGE